MTAYGDPCHPSPMDHEHLKLSPGSPPVHGPPLWRLHTGPCVTRGTVNMSSSQTQTVGQLKKRAVLCVVTGCQDITMVYSPVRAGFFKRSVQNNKRYTCADAQCCPMDPAQRKRCPYCRFQKCLAVGMKKEAVRADRMRGGRNKFGPLYRRDRQMKQQRGSYHQTNTAPYRVKIEGPQALVPAAPHDFHVLNPSSASLDSDHYHPPQTFHPSMSQSEFPMLLDCTIPKDRTLPDPSLPFHTMCYPGFHGYPPEKRELPFSYSPASVTPPAPISPTVLSTPAPTPTATLTPTSTPSSTPTPAQNLTPSSTPVSSSCFLNELLQAEPDEKQLCTRIEVSTILSQAGATLSSLVSRAQDLVSKLRSLQLDREEFVCLKYLVLFNPDVKSVQDRRQVEQTQERVNRALMDHTMQTHPGHSDKFGQLLLRLPEVRSISLQVEEYLYQRHLLGDLPCNSLLTEMLHAKHT
ncbi:Nuclear receptor subfamily 5 group A member 2 [Labeo rohita]|uniref:Nuclear receptor subfamily 5 group A member 2 n=1 Tax=Labeo rohita TaxID=84645 RepID=A0ABQ8MT67_LABRO|nr:Nuclear receptor subfamily 5 group A member 2 [Labeo rohita]